jgi:hypothetical protein
MIQLSTRLVTTRLAPPRVLAAATVVGLLAAACGSDVPTATSPPPASYTASTAVVQSPPPIAELGLPGTRASPAGEYGWTGDPGSFAGMHKVVQSSDAEYSQTQLTFAVEDDCFAYGTDVEPVQVTVAGLDGLYVEPYGDPGVTFMPPPRGEATTGAYALPIGDRTLCVYLTWDPDSPQVEVEAARQVLESLRGEARGERHIRINFTLPEGWDTG